MEHHPVVLAVLPLLFLSAPEGSAQIFYQDPQSVTVRVGETATFNTGHNGHVTFQWQKDGTDIPGATAPSYTIPSVQISDFGTYTVTATKAADGYHESRTAELRRAVGITTQPQPQAVPFGGTATFSVQAVGTNLAYRWRKNGTDIAGERGATLQIADVQQLNLGAYDVVVMNTGGTTSLDTATSNTAELSQGVSITRQPTGARVTAGTTISLSVTAVGEQPLRYQWRKDGTDLPEGSGAELTITRAQMSDAGEYAVVVTGGAGTATSNAATVTVAPRPYKKVGESGQALSDDAEAWSCADDTTADLMWEVKTTDQGLRDWRHIYTWYDSTLTAAEVGTQNSQESCSGTLSYCNTSAYIAAVNNAALCGATDWRLPSLDELNTLVEAGAQAPTIRTSVFPHTQPDRGYWTSTAYSDASLVWQVGFAPSSPYYISGQATPLGKNYAGYIRLVRPSS